MYIKDWNFLKVNVLGKYQTLNHFNLKSLKHCIFLPINKILCIGPTI